ncbi:MAG: hypothetical protein ACHQU8_00550 [Gemmatimonadales bacterium]
MLPFTVAAAVLLLDQATVALPIALPFESFTTAVYCLVLPVVLSVSLPVDETVSEAATCVTLMGALALKPEAEATAVSLAPTASAVTKPAALTEAVAPVPARLQTMAGAPETVAPLASTTAALSCRVEPIAPKATLVGVI